MPPRVFWSACALVVYLITPGWIWHLTQVTIRATMSRKDDISDVSFDIFQNVALGIKLFVWGIVYVLPLFFIFPVALLMYPLAMIHFTTPVTKKAWLSPAMLGVLLRNLGPTLYYCFVAFVVNLAGFLGYFAIWFFFSASLAAVATAMQGSAAVGAMGWVMLGVAIGVSVLCTSFLAFASIFTMRVNGLLGYYFKDRLDLTLIVAEQKYVPGKRDQYDAFGERIKTKGEKTFVIVMAILVPLIVAGVGYYVWYTFWRKQ
jgi:hypothetical protein